MTSPILPLLRHFLIERPAARRSLADLADTLEQGASRLTARIAAAPDTPRNRDQLRHIIGLERWGQRRLRVALGEPPTRDEMDEYQPPAGASMGELREAFATTRRETVALARELAARGADPRQLIDHNQLGPLTARGWLAYLNTHAGLEGMRLR